MRIYSKISDYYDSALGYGFDPTCVYVRHAEEFGYNTPEDRAMRDLIDTLNIKRPGNEYNGIGAAYSTVLFCGKVYPCVYLTKNLYGTGGVVKEYCYSAEQVRAFCEQNLTQKQFSAYMSGKLPRKERFAWSQSPFVHAAFERMFAASGAENAKVLDLQQQFKIPVMRRSHSTYHRHNENTEFNPVLKDIQFYRAVDAFSAFQELSMFISGVLGGQSPAVVEITDDEIKIAKHGFNEWSFRTPPGEKK